MDDSKEYNIQDDPVGAHAIPLTKEDNNIALSKDNTAEESLPTKPIRERKMTEKGYAYWKENREVRRSNQSHFGDITRDIISEVKNLMSSYENIDRVKQGVQRLLRSYKDFSRQFDNEDERMSDASFIRISSDVRNTELQVSKWLRDFQSCEKGSCKSSKSSRHTKSDKSKSSVASSSTVDNFIKNKTKLVELKKEQNILKRKNWLKQS